MASWMRYWELCTITNPTLIVEENFDKYVNLKILIRVWAFWGIQIFRRKGVMDASRMDFGQDYDPSWLCKNFQLPTRSDWTELGPGSWYVIRELWIVGGLWLRLEGWGLLEWVRFGLGQIGGSPNLFVRYVYYSVCNSHIESPSIL